MLTEKEIRKQVKEYLKLNGWFVFHNFQKGKECYNGISDLTALKHGNVLWLEIKTETGKQSDGQVKFQTDIENAGGNYFVIRSIVDMEIILKNLDYWKDFF